MVSALLSRSTATTSTEKSGGSNSNSTALTTTAAAASPPPGARQRLLICAPSNTAVDELLARLSGGVLDHTGQLRQVRIVRLGEPLEGASQAIQKLTLDAQIEDRLKLDPAAVKLQTAKELIRSLEREYDALPSRLKTQAYTSSSGSGSNGVYPPAGESASGNTLSKEQQKVRNLRSEIATQRQVKVWAEMNLERARNSLRQVILLEADIVGATLSGSGRKQFLDLALHNDVTFDTTIIDEAAQTTEPSCLIPLRLGCRRLVLVGDPRQLPATVLSKPAARAGLGRSLFERLERADHEVVMLTIQYRMHPGKLFLILISVQLQSSFDDTFLFIFIRHRNPTISVAILLPELANGCSGGAGTAAAVHQPYDAGSRAIPGHARNRRHTRWEIFPQRGRGAADNEPALRTAAQPAHGHRRHHHTLQSAGEQVQSGAARGTRGGCTSDRPPPPGPGGGGELY